MEKFKCNTNCEHCEFYEPGGWYYTSDRDYYEDEGCQIRENPKTCESYLPTTAQELSEALVKIEELKAKLPIWHKVADGDLPTGNEVYVLHTIYNGVFTGWYENGKWWKPGFSPYSDDEVIAWCEAPKYEG